MGIRGRCKLGRTYKSCKTQVCGGFRLYLRYVLKISKYSRRNKFHFRLIKLKTLVTKEQVGVAVVPQYTAVLQILKYSGYCNTPDTVILQIL